MEKTKKFCVYAADSHEAYIAQLEETVLPEETVLEQDGICFKAVRFYEIDRNELVVDRRTVAEEAFIRARMTKHFFPELSQFLLKMAEKYNSPDKVEKRREALRKSEAEAKKTLYEIYKEKRRKLEQEPRKPYAPEPYDTYLYPNANHRVGRVFFASLDEAFGALYNAWKDLKRDWDKPGKLEEMFSDI